MAPNTTKYLSDICDIIGNTIDTEEIYLFGSYAYGEPTTDSDFDLYVVIPDGTLRPADAVKRIRRAVFPIQTIPLDVIVCRSEEFQRRQQYASLERKICREGVLLRGRQNTEPRMA